MSESAVKTAYAVRCMYHGLVYLTYDEYVKQMENPNDLWRCPRFIPDKGYCGSPSEFDDDNYESELLK